MLLDVALDLDAEAEAIEAEVIIQALGRGDAGCTRTSNTLLDVETVEADRT